MMGNELELETNKNIPVSTQVIRRLYIKWYGVCTLNDMEFVYDVIRCLYIK